MTSVARKMRYVDNERGSVPRLGVTMRVSRNLQLRIAEKARAMGVTTNEYLVACVKRDLDGASW